METSFKNGDKVVKLSKKPFKSKLLVNTITGFVINEQDPKKRVAATFAEDDSIVNVDTFQLATKLNEAISLFGKEALNTLTKFPSILTLHDLGERGVLLDTTTTPIDDVMYGSEKIDGTNARTSFFRDSYFIGSRDNVLSANGDLYFDKNQGIVEGLEECIDLEQVQESLFNLFPEAEMITIYGELYGKKYTSTSKQYGTERSGFRLFDVAVYGKEVYDLLAMPLSQLSLWREHGTEETTNEGLVYGQPFVDLQTLDKISEVAGIERVPALSVAFPMDITHQSIWDFLNINIPQTLAALSETALKRPEGLVFRSADRKRIVKVRFEDYARTLGIKIK